MCLIYLLMDTTNATTKSEENAKIYFYNIFFVHESVINLGTNLYVFVHQVITNSMAWRRLVLTNFDTYNFFFTY